MTQYEINHATGKVFAPGQVPVEMKLLGVKGDIYAFYRKGTHYYGGQGRPQNYAPARVIIVKAFSQRPQGNSTEIMTGDELMSWTGFEQNFRKKKEPTS